MTSTRNDDEDKVKKAYTKALLHSLEVAGVKFLRYHALDTVNGTRCKAKPIKILKSSLTSLDNQVSMAQICFGGLPNFADFPSPNCGLTAQGSVLLKPDMNTLRILPYADKTALVLSNLHNQETGEPSDLCCRGLLQQVCARAAKEHNIEFHVGAELEFSLFDAKTNVPVDSTNFASSQTLNQQEDFISDLHDQLQRQEIEVELIHAESGHGQVEVVLQYCRDPVQLADNVVLSRETISNVARLHGLKALFLPKINRLAAGHGCHVHISFCDITTGQNLFPNNNTATAASSSNKEKRHESCILGSSSHDISAQGQSFMEGILQHLPALLALTIPTVNSFRRVGPGCWTGSDVGWEFEEKEAPIRVVADLAEQSWNRFEMKLCDSTANLYLALVGILAAGLDGLSNKLTLRPALGDNDQQQGQDGKGVPAAPAPPPLPSTVEDSFELLEQDNLLMSSVLPRAMSRAYLATRRAEYKRASDMSLEDEVEEALGRA